MEGQFLIALHFFCFCHCGMPPSALEFMLEVKFAEGHEDKARKQQVKPDGDPSALAGAPMDPRSSPNNGAIAPPQPVHPTQPPIAAPRYLHSQHAPSLVNPPLPSAADIYRVPHLQQPQFPTPPAPLFAPPAPQWGYTPSPLLAPGMASVSHPMHNTLAAPVLYHSLPRPPLHATTPLPSVLSARQEQRNPEHFAKVRRFHTWSGKMPALSTIHIITVALAAGDRPMRRPALDSSTTRIKEKDIFRKPTEEEAKSQSRVSNDCFSSYWKFDVTRACSDLSDRACYWYAGNIHRSLSPECLLQSWSSHVRRRISGIFSLPSPLRNQGSMESRPWRHSTSLQLSFWRFCLRY